MKHPFIKALNLTSFAILIVSFHKFDESTPVIAFFATIVLLLWNATVLTGTFDN